MAADVKPRLRDEERTLVDVNNREITIYGHVEIPVTFGSVKCSLPVVVCDVLNEGILGQDFLMKNVQKLDLQKMMLIIDQGNIQCWTGGEAVMVCSVAVKQTVIIPPETRSVIPITIPKKDHLAELGLVETPATVISQKNFSLIPGIVDTKSQDLQAVIQNFSSNPITLYPNMKLGTCESYYEKSPAGNCCRVAEPPTTSTNTTSGLPEHLVDLMTRSTKHLDFEESLKLKKLLIKFQSVFATSSDDLGRTDLVQHTINTGPANPIRQCPRRLPFGKREQTNDDIESQTENAGDETNPYAEVGHVCVITRGQQRTSGPTTPPNTVSLPGWEPAQFRQLQLQDKDISPIMTLLDDGSNRPGWNDISHLSMSSFACWLCPEKFKSNRDRKNHLISRPHERMRVLCPFCPLRDGKKEKSLRRMSDLKVHIADSHKAEKRISSDSLPSDFFSEANGFWLAVHPKDYLKLITPNSWRADAAVRARTEMIRWIRANQLSKRRLQELEQ
uniref:C2H2-type domain-containing protein n=1 Tax=Magallana gigas TaxID=29159 RepID=A0A8W8M469_MAGGI